MRVFVSVLGGDLIKHKREAEPDTQKTQQPQKNANKEQRETPTSVWRDEKKTRDLCVVGMNV